MMRYSVTFLERDYEQLQELLRHNARVENAAYLLCRLSRTDDEVRLLVKEVIAIDPSHVLEASSSHMKIASASFRSTMKRADAEKCAFIFVHTHPDGFLKHSQQDDAEESPLFKTAYVRIHNDDAVHASLVFCEGRISAARVWLTDGSAHEVERVRIIGKRFRFWFSQHSTEPIPDFYDRQVRAFGPEQTDRADNGIGVWQLENGASIFPGAIESACTNKTIRSLALASGSRLNAFST